MSNDIQSLRVKVLGKLVIMLIFIEYYNFRMEIIFTYLLLFL